ncbi:MAG: P pilus assembly chaperone PapD [Zhongshania aliphaticivorans]|uniref:Pili assembly chaperone N-terminal domain-containing protein n=1 Tax=Zhongshania aliphaticivorans TaxID=1470434 RepID=A0A127M9C3_9GAMM|nr:fimbria/pilus periplasmic chaperone [Zhongshania aliphaticivorans]AMO69842.1 hypothetical protein AZF00_16720 [Zhongshania aliphaticivorans]
MKHILFIFLFIGLANSGQAQITVDRNIIDLSAGARRADINVSNTGKNTETVDISLFAIIDPGLDSEQRHSPENPRELGVLATPRQFTLAQGQSRKVRISFLKTATVKDGIYRMRVTPRSESSGNSKPAGTAVSIAIAYELLLILRPPKPDARLLAHRDQKSLTVNNPGNSNVMLFDGKQCNKLGEACQQLAGKRIYSGAGHVFALPYPDTPVRFMLDDGSNTRGVEY